MDRDTLKSRVKEINSNELEYIAELERLKLLFNAVKDGIFDWNLRTKEIYFNLQYLDILGYKHGETPMPPETWLNLIHPDDRDSLKKIYDECARGNRETFEKEYRIRAKSGEWRWIRTFARIVERDESGKAIRMIGTHTDITDRKKIELELLESEDKFSKAFQMNLDFYGITSINEGRFAEVNEAFLNSLGYLREEVIGRTSLELGVWEDPGQRDAMLQLIKRDGICKDIQVSFRKKSGEIIYGLFSATVIHLLKGPMLLCIFKDITKFKQALNLLHLQKDMSIGLAASSEFGQVANLVLDAVSKINEIDSGGLYIRDPGTGALNLIAHRGFTDSFVKSVSCLGPETSHAVLVTKGEPIYISYSGLNVKKDKSRDDEGLKAVSIIPIIHDKNIIACLNLCSHSHDAFPPGTRDSLEAIAGMLGDALSRIKAESEVREKNAMIKAVMESPSGISMYSIDKNYCYTLFNDNHRRDSIAVFNKDIRIGLNILDGIIQKDLSEKIKRDFDRALAGEAFSDIRERDGLYFAYTWNPVYGEKREVIGASCFAQDITERKKTENALRQEAEMRQILLENLPCIALIIKKGTREIVFSNELARKAGAVPGKKCYEGWAMRDTPCRFCRAPETWCTGISKHLEFDFGGKHYNAMWLPMSEELYVHYIFDITVFKRMEEERLRLEQQLQQSQKLESLGILAGGIAHDFNNQLSCILGYTDMLHEEIGDSPVSEYTDNIRQTIKRSTDLISQLLAFSRKGKFQLLSVDLNKIINDLVNILKHSIDKRISIRTDLKASPATIIGDPSQMQNILLNLAFNSRDAMPDGGELIFSTDIAVFAEEVCLNGIDYIGAGKYIALSVSDTGIGMDEEIKSHLYEPFFTTKEEGKGTGMGLPAVYGTVKNHKGTIQVESEPGKGAIFRLYLPLEDSPAEDKIITVYDIPANIPARIMLVEDEEPLRKVSGKILKKLGYEVILCPDGSEAVKKYKKFWKDIDLVIIDLIMPVMNGRDAFINMRRINPDIKALFVSGYSLNSSETVIEEGIMGFLQKPLRKEELSRKIEEILKEKRSGHRL